MLFPAVAAVHDDAEDVVRGESRFELLEFGQIGRDLLTIGVTQGLHRIQIVQQPGRIIRITQERI